jgi:hypothetical protein
MIVLHASGNMGVWVWTDRRHRNSTAPSRITIIIKHNNLGREPWIGLNAMGDTVGPSHLGRAKSWVPPRGCAAIDRLGAFGGDGGGDGGWGGRTGTASCKID